MKTENPSIQPSACHRFIRTVTLFVTALVLSVTHLQAQEAYTGSRTHLIQRLTVNAMNNFYETILVTCMEKESFQTMSLSISQNKLTSDYVLKPDYLRQQRLDNLSTLDNYLLLFRDTYRSWLETAVTQPDALTINTSEPVFHRITHLPDNRYGLEIVFDYKVTIRSFNQTLYEGKTSSVVRFNDMENLEHIQIKQISPLSVQQEPELFPGYHEVKAKADAGDAKSCYTIGMHYRLNTDNMEQAIRWLTLAAEKGHISSQYNLGIYYLYGSGIPKDLGQAFQWFTKAAEQNNPDAQCALGSCHFFGYGTSVDYIQAVLWYRKAAEQGHAMSCSNLGVCYQFGQGVEKDLNLAVAWYQKGAEKGHDGGQNDLAWCYENGQGVGKDLEKAIYWYRKAANQGNKQAKKRLEVLQP